MPEKQRKVFEITDLHSLSFSECMASSLSEEEKTALEIRCADDGSDDFSIERFEQKGSDVKTFSWKDSTGQLIFVNTLGSECVGDASVKCLPDNTCWVTGVHTHQNEGLGIATRTYVIINRVLWRDKKTYLQSGNLIEGGQALWQKLHQLFPQQVNVTLDDQGQKKYAFTSVV